MRVKPLLLLSLALLTACASNREGAAPPPIVLPPETTPLSANSILHHLQRDDVRGAFALYQRRHGSGLGHDFGLLHEMGRRVLESGISSYDPEVQLLSIAGAQLTWSDVTIPLLENAADSPNPSVQLAALYALVQHGDRRAIPPLKRAMGSMYLPVRLDAARMLTYLEHSNALGQVEALMSKLPSEFTPFFPPLFAVMETPSATTRLRRLMNHENPRAAAIAIRSAAMTGRDDLLSDIRMVGAQLDPSRREASAAALGQLADGSAIDQLYELTTVPQTAVRVAAWKALYDLHEPDAGEQLITEARRSLDPFAIYALAEIEGSSAALAGFLNAAQPEVRANAAFALLLQRDERCLPLVLELLVQDARDVAILPVRSPGLALTAWRLTPSSHQQFRNDPAALAESVAVREGLLQQINLLPSGTIIAAVERVVQYDQRELLPLSVELLEQHGGPEAIALLQAMHQLPGRPLVRLYAALGLYRMNVEGAFAEELTDWVRDTRQHEIIRFRPHLKLDELATVPYQELTPLETSRLLLETCQTLAEKQQEEGIDTLIELIVQGHEKNRYALMGLLIRATT